VELSPRVRRPGGVIDDNVWMRRVAAIRDAFARLGGPGREARVMLGELGGPVMATLVGAIVGAAVRRTPMLIDGPVAAAAALVSRDFSLGAPKWCYAPDRLPHPVVSEAADQIGLAEPLGFGVDLGEGCAALHALPLLQETLTTVSELSYLPPQPEDDDDDDDADADETADDGDAT
jgi:nicotinate-nucleotide--dimethylbenzimidazole phosphoribosyltransferase